MKIVRFRRDLVAIGSESARQGPVIDRIRTDKMGNLVGHVGPSDQGKVHSGKIGVAMPARPE
ncbi:MAG: hypothetical protein V3W34_05110 [Phycisphaerae bacterium]